MGGYSGGAADATIGDDENMKIGLIDVDGHNYPNLPLMKLSAWHKQQGDSVEWYSPMFSGHCDKVYMSKVFSFTPDYPYFIDADKIIKGGSGYCIELVDGKEVYHRKRDMQLPPEVEHIYPDYSLYPELTKDTAYGFMSRGCPRGCEFCHVAAKEGQHAYKTADLSEFWNGQKNIVLCDPNTLACAEWRDILQQLIDSGAYVDFNQGLDIRLMTEEKAQMIKRIKIKTVHFAWDNYEDRHLIVPKLKMFKEITGWDRRKMTVYMLTNFNTTFDQDLQRVYEIRDLGYWPDVRIYNKTSLPKGHDLLRLQRWCNFRAIFETIKNFDDYK